MNTIEFAVQDGVPYAIDFLNPAPDFERDRITDFYFEHVVEKMAHLVIDRALQRDPSQSLAAVGGDARPRRGAPASSAPAGVPQDRRLDGRDRARGTRCSRPGTRADAAVHPRFAGSDARAQAHVRRPGALPVPAAVLPDGRRRSAHADRGGDASRRSASAWRARRSAVACALRAARAERGRSAAGADRSRLRAAPAPPRGSTRSCCPTRCTSPSTTPSRPPGPRYTQRLCELFDVDCAVMGRFRQAVTCASTRTIAPLLDALVASYREWGGTRDPADDRDRRLARGADLERVRDPARRLHRLRRADAWSAIRAS